MELDAIDAAIVRELRVDGRLPFETLAGRIGLSRAAARLRVRRLLDSGSLRIVGVAHPTVRDIGTLAHLAIRVGGGATPVAEAVARLPEVRAVRLTSGRFPLSVEAQGGDLPRLSGVIDRIRSLPGVREIDTTVYTHVVKDPVLAAAQPPGAEPDEVDRSLIGLLERNGRLSFAELAGHVGLSPGAVRGRVMRMLRERVLRVTALLDPAAIGLVRQGGFALRLASDGGEAVKELSSWEHTRFLTRCLGHSDLMGTVAAESVSTLHTVYERLRALPGVQVTETWIHLDDVKPPLGQDGAPPVGR
ncbi:DNA-binding Lrp family transcriptional regulator [Nocardiopsis mwathae]|uniref:DNA-binding Lrp family transcriptional regulator n=1 Tax=Nocardiopsis mwathae TaxID=1472723 RepID=A0A7W9YG67_9ACTN|nr:Lrp/AsnC family transcriptional regulator [Nocardiopsis mwathae]MBB6170696.1 DNA-binding Lrp family transcriptional regulator [Nocardiopsis mwathae]